MAGIAGVIELSGPASAHSSIISGIVARPPETVLRACLRCKRFRFAAGNDFVLALAFRKRIADMETGRLVVDGPLANRVRSGRKQP